MKSEQYEELCRFFLSEKLGLPIEAIRSVEIPNPQRPDLPEYRHQIDLYWEQENELSKYLHIANAKWRTSDKVDQPDVMLLQQVKQKVAAHKALMITSTGFTSGALAVAKDEGIALHVVKPATALAGLPTGDRLCVQRAVQQLAASSSRPIYSHTVEHRGFDGPLSTSSGGRAGANEQAAGGPAYRTRVVTSFTTREGGGYSNRGVGAGPETRSGGSFTRGGGSGHRK